jgi:hypothetical protein
VQPNTVQEHTPVTNILHSRGADHNQHHRGDAIYAALAEETRLSVQFANRYRRGQQAPLTLQELSGYYKGGKAIAKTDRLFREEGITRDHPDWRPGGAKYVQYQKRASFKAIHALQTQIIHCLTERAAEMTLLHRRLGQTMAKRFLQAINGRWKLLSKLVDDYNLEVRKYNRTAGVIQPLRQLNADNLRANGLDNGEI